MATVQRRPRILCLADAFPWPARDGYRHETFGGVEKPTAHGAGWATHCPKVGAPHVARSHPFQVNSAPATQKVDERQRAVEIGAQTYHHTADDQAMTPEPQSCRQIGRGAGAAGLRPFVRRSSPQTNRRKTLRDYD